MATKPRHLKTPLQLWIADHRKALELSSLDLANLTGVTEDTARHFATNRHALDMQLRGIANPQAILRPDPGR